APNGGLMRGFAPAPRWKERCLLTILSGPRSSWFLVYQSQLSIRGQGASMPLPARLELSKRCYWLCQTSGWNEWAVTTPAASPATFNSVRYAHKSQKAKKPKSQKAKKRLPAAGRKNLFELLRFFPAQSGQPAAEKRR